MLNKKPEKYLKIQVLAVVFICLSLLLSLGIYVVDNINHEHLHEDITAKVASTKQIFLREIENEALQLHGLIKIIDDDPELINLLLQENRDELLKTYGGLYHYLNQHFNVTHFYFSNSQRVNVLRVHNPSRFGDVINRQTTLQAEKKHDIFYGVELGTFGQLTLRLVKPVYDNNSLIGFIELGKEIEALVHSIRDTLKTDIMVTVYKKYLNRSSWEEGMKLMNRPADWDRLSESVLIESTLESPEQSYELILNGDDNHNYLISGDHDLDDHKAVQGKYLKYLFYIPVHEVSGREVADLIVVLDYQEISQFVKRETLMTALIGFSIVVVMAVLLFFILQIGQNAIIKYRQELYLANQTLEKKVDERTRQLEVARLAAEEANLEKSRFLANMSHELRTPMHSIMSFATLALKRTDDEKGIRFLQNIRTSGIRLTTLLNDLLDLSKIESGKMDFHPVEQDLTTLFEQSTAEIASLLSKKNISIVLDTDNHFECMIDQKLIVQVIINLLSNAVKFSPKGSQINIEISTITHKTGNKKHEYVRAAVIDQGVGIPADELDAVFDKFVQSSKTRSKNGGTGLGLPISKEIIDLHRGNIWAESPPFGRASGTAIYFEIPINGKLNHESQSNDLNSIVNDHIAWKEAVDSAFVSFSGETQQSVSLASNSDLCGLGQWINKQSFESQTFEELKSVHNEFHELVGEYVAYASAGNVYKANELREKYQSKSEQLTSLLRNFSS